eukprot:TRINITY_DN10729_c0_g1_i1.p1 TRINITY_DN10729_c0_g1~~TRINITY_DN10729_c0_g1_i1.p1  ORF type:complete len:266 (+),score=107.80 TRINITY_DN10729_c0_g1_i1:52-798(+)
MPLGWVEEALRSRRRGRAIEGVSQDTIMKMRAELYHRGAGSGGGGGRGTQKTLAELLRNPGVDARIKAEVEELQKETDVEGRLRAKAALYDRLKAGGGSLEDAKDSNVDFEAVVYGDTEEPAPVERRGVVAGLLAAREGGDAARTRLWETTAEDDLAAEAEQRRLKQQLIHSIAAETRQARAEVEHVRAHKRKRLDHRLQLVKARRKERRMADAARRREALLNAPSDTDSELGSFISSDSAPQDGSEA